jgi:transcriptional repressor NrdR
MEVQPMQCPFCQHTDSRVLESRSSEFGRSIRRRRECLSCQRRFTTYERIEFVPLVVVKRDGKRESFDSSKLLRGMVRACEKTGIEPSLIETIVDEIESEIQQRSLREVCSSELGELVLLRLRSLSEVAYVRFASVYRQFRGIRDFVETLDRLQEERLQQGAGDSDETAMMPPVPPVDPAAASPPPPLVPTPASSACTPSS